MNKEDPTAGKKFQEIQQAYDVRNTWPSLSSGQAVCLPFLLLKLFETLGGCNPPLFLPSPPPELPLVFYFVKLPDPLSANTTPPLARPLPERKERRKRKSAL